MRTLHHFVAAALVCSTMTGCANFDTIRTFAKDGSGVALAVQGDAQMLRTSCDDVRQHELVLAWADSRAPQPSECNRVVEAQERAAASLSVDLLVRYHETLNALATDSNWSLAQQIGILGASVKRLGPDVNSALPTAESVAAYQKAFAAIADAMTSALREREAQRLLDAKLDWKEALAPLRFWYGGADGRTTSFFSEGCRLINTEWANVRSEVAEYANCIAPQRDGKQPCEPLAGAERLLRIDSSRRSVMACAPGRNDGIAPAAVARVKMIDDWLAANDAMRTDAFKPEPQRLKAQLDALRTQVEAVRMAAHSTQEPLKE